MFIADPKESIVYLYPEYFRKDAFTDITHWAQAAIHSDNCEYVLNYLQNTWGISNEYRGCIETFNADGIATDVKDKLLHTYDYTDWENPLAIDPIAISFQALQFYDNNQTTIINAIFLYNSNLTNTEALSTKLVPMNREDRLLNIKGTYGEMHYTITKGNRRTFKPIRVENLYLNINPWPDCELIKFSNYQTQYFDITLKSEAEIYGKNAIVMTNETYVIGYTFSDWNMDEIWYPITLVCLPSNEYLLQAIHQPSGFIRMDFGLDICLGWIEGNELYGTFELQYGNGGPDNYTLNIIESMCYTFIDSNIN